MELKYQQVSTIIPEIYFLMISLHFLVYLPSTPLMLFRIDSLGWEILQQDQLPSFTLWANKIFKKNLF